MTALTEDRIGELRKLHEAASPAPWCADSFATPEDSLTRLAIDDGTGYGLRLAEFDWETKEEADLHGEREAPPLLVAEANAKLAAAARNALPALLDAASASLSHRTRADGLDERVRELEQALRPFARFSSGHGPFGREDSWTITRNITGTGDLTMGDVRAAERALTPRALVPEVTNG